MTQSIYVGRGDDDEGNNDHDEDDNKSQDSDDLSDLESFCILEEEEGSGIVASTGEPTIRTLYPEGVQVPVPVLSYSSTNSVSGWKKKVAA